MILSLYGTLGKSCGNQGIPRYSLDVSKHIHKYLRDPSWTIIIRGPLAMDDAESKRQTSPRKGDVTKMQTT